MDEMLTKLYGSTDAAVWANEFCALFSVYADDGEVVDDALGLMIGWFANAIETAKDHERRRMAEQLMGFPVKIDVDRLGRVSRAARSS